MTTSLLLLLKQQFQQLVQLNELLLIERETLSSRSPEDVEQITKQKMSALDQLQATDKQITNTFTEDDLKAPEAQDIKQQIEQALIELKHQNEVNAKILNHKQVSSNMLKEVLIGNRKDKSATTYDQLGKKSNTLKSRPIKA